MRVQRLPLLSPQNSNKESNHYELTLIIPIPAFSREPEQRGENVNLKRRKLSGRSSLLEKLSGGVEEIGPATHILLARHGSQALTTSVCETIGIRAR